jgi:heat shock protein HslJ
MKKLALVFLLALLTACGSKGALPLPAESGLPAQLYVLQAINGEAATAWERQPEIAFDDGMRVSGQVCNRFIGPGTYEKGILTVPVMAMTMMLCLDPKLDQLERDFTALLRDGAQVALEGNALTLSGEKITLLYTRVGP